MEDYKILIADDEPIECVALEMLLKSNFSFVTVMPGVHNGFDLITAIKEGEPDIVIVDINMPGMTGLDALEMVRRQYPDMKILIHSAYSEFDYARRAFALQAADYIVKPIQKPVFLETMRTLFESLQKERRARSSQETITGLTGELTRLMENDIMSSVILGEIDTRTENLFLRSLGHAYTGGFFVTVRFSGPGMTGEFEERLLSVLRLSCPCFSRRYHEDLLLFFVPGEEVTEENFGSWAHGLLEKAIPGSLIGVSSWKYTVEELPDALRESSAVLTGKKEAGVYLFSYQAGQEQVDVFREARGEIRALFRKGETEAAARRAREELQKAEKKGVSLDSLKVHSSYLLLCLYEEATKDARPEAYAEPYIQNAWKVFGSCERCGELFSKLSEAIEELKVRLSPSPTKAKEYVTKAILYIRRYYAENLSVEDVASKIGISSFYLSRLLKQEYEETFVEILTRVRITKALSLLPDKNLSIAEIGEKAGYPNTTYFYKVFKKHTGMTVGEARRHLDQ